MKEMRLNSDNVLLVRNATKIQHKIDEIKSTNNYKILIYGAGGEAVFLLDVCVFSGLEIKICDENRKGYLGKYPIMKPTVEVYDWCNVILITPHSKDVCENIIKQIPECYYDRIRYLHDDDFGKPYSVTEVETGIPEESNGYLQYGFTQVNIDEYSTNEFK